MNIYHDFRNADKTAPNDTDEWIYNDLDCLLIYTRRCIYASMHRIIVIQVMAFRLFVAKPLPEPMPNFGRLDHQEQISAKLESINCIWNCCLQNADHFVSAYIC